jgi:hypothetical protein
MEIKVVRLTSGEDIIGKIEFLDNGFIEIYDPMVFMVKDTGKTMNLLMQHWLPVNLLSKNEAVIAPINVVTVCEPNEQFSEYYSNTVDKYNSVVSSSDKEPTEEELAQIMEAMNQVGKETRIIH